MNEDDLKGFEGLEDIVDDGTEVVTYDKIFRTNYDGTYREDVTDQWASKRI